MPSTWWSALLSVTALVVNLSAQTGPPKPTVPSLSEVRDTSLAGCADPAVGELLESPDTRAFLEAFEYNIDEVAMVCATLKSAWLRTDLVLSLRHARGLDDYQEVTLVRTSSEPKLWLIPITDGMICKPSLEVDPHNLAAFNALLRDNGIRTSTAEDLTSLSLLYVNMVGTELYVVDRVSHGQLIPGMMSERDRLRRMNLLPAVLCEDKKKGKRECTVTINEAQAGAGL